MTKPPHPQSPVDPTPSLRRGWDTFASRPVSLMAALVLAVVLSVATFGLLFPPAVAGFYAATRGSRPERFFIDLERVAETLRGLLRGMRRHFLASFALGIVAVVLPVALLLALALVLEHMPLAWVLALQVLLVPAFFLNGAALLHGYPALVEGGTAGQAIRACWEMGKRAPFRSILLGILVLLPPVAFVFHLGMALSYPLLVASTVAAESGEGGMRAAPRPVATRPLTPTARVLLGVALVGGAIGGYALGGGPGALFWIGLWLAFFVLAASASLGMTIRIFGLAIGFTALLLGGGSLVAREWGEAYLIPWVVGGIVLLILALRRMKGDWDEEKGGS